jgi:trehalose 6-phosphate phosphatase
VDAFPALAADPPAAALVMDFDGVLSPIVSDPAASAITPEGEQALTRLVGRLGLVALVSGRPLAFLREKVQIPGIGYYGSYGVESLVEGRPVLDAAAESWLPAVQAATRRLHDEFDRYPGLFVEEKAVSVAIHWRNAPDVAAAERQVAAVVHQIEESTGLHREPGKLVEEFRPPIDVDKGTALRGIMASSGLSTFAYAGDDKGDLPAFRAVAEAGGHCLVVDHGPETDPRLLEIADETFAGVSAFAGWLTRLADQVGG